MSYHHPMCADYCSNCFTCTSGRDSLVTCAGCDAFYYCGPPHLEADRINHESDCRLFADLQRRLQKAEKDGVDESGCDHQTMSFILSLRQTQRTLPALVGTIPLGEPFGLEYWHMHFSGLMQSVLGELVSVLLPRLDHDQACYELIKYHWSIDGSWDDTIDAVVGYVESPWPARSSIFDRPSGISTTYASNQAAAWAAELMLKVKALLNLRDLDKVHMLSGRVPGEVLISIKESLALPLLTNDADFLRSMRRGERLSTWAEKLGDCTTELYKGIEDKDGLFWSMFQDRDEDFAVLPTQEKEGPASRLGCLLKEAMPKTPGELGTVEITERETRASLRALHPIIAGAPETVDWVRDVLVPTQAKESNIENSSALK